MRRIATLFSDLTFGTMMVLFHVALADREAGRRQRSPGSSRERAFRSQVSP